MSKLMRWPILSLSITLFLGCAPDPNENLDAPRAFFGKQKIGTSPDYGIVKFGNIKDHVITVHGFTDDLASCQQIVRALNKDACKEITDASACLDPDSCQPLNH
ncbi:MAG: hypothetical protein ACREGD_05035 [Candidatus Saccharimonadales bacterium]